MTQLDVIRMIGDLLTEIDVVVGSLVPGDPDLTALQDLRRLLDARQLILSRQVFEDNTERFQSAAAQLKGINDEVRLTIRQIENMAAVIQNVTRFLNGVTKFLTVIGGVI
jgi:hypothetical protein